MTESSITIQRLDHTSETHVVACAALFQELMKDDVALLSLCGGEAELLAPMARAMIRACGLAGEYYIATKNEELAGFCLWMPPGHAIFSTDEQRELGLQDFMAQLSDAAKQYYKDIYLAQFPQFVAACLGSPKWKDDYWWVHSMMVSPKYQRQGIATALMNVVRTKTVAPIALSTTTRKNAHIYSTLGFELKGNKLMPSPWGDWPLFVLTLQTAVAT